MLFFLPQISTEPGNQYNVSLINALVLFVGTQAIAYIHSKGSTPSASTIAYTAHMDIFQHLLVDLDTEGKNNVCVCVCVQVSSDGMIQGTVVSMHHTKSTIHHSLLMY